VEKTLWYEFWRVLCILSRCHRDEDVATSDKEAQIVGSSCAAGACEGFAQGGTSELRARDGQRPS